MNAIEERQLRTWLEARDPGDAPARLRAAAAAAPDTSRPRTGVLDYVPVRVFGQSWSLRPLVVLLVVLGLVGWIVGAGLLWRWLQFPPKGLIAYSVPLAETGSSGIRLIAADGSGARQITAAVPNLYEHAQRWSPDGRTLAFARLSNLDAFSSCVGIGSIVLYDVASGSERILASDVQTVQEIAWSPSGDRVAYIGPNSGCSESTDLGVIDIVSGAVTHSALGPGLWSLRWSGSSVVGVPLDPTEHLPFEVLTTEVPSIDGRFVAKVAGPGRRFADSLVVEGSATGAAVDLGAGGSPAWAPDGSSIAFIQYTNAPAEDGLSFRDRLAIASAGTWTVRTLADVMILDAPGNPSLVRLPPLWWTRDGAAIYWMDMAGGHVLELATGRVVDLPKDLNGCDDLQWQPTPRAD